MSKWLTASIVPKDSEFANKDNRSRRRRLQNGDLNLNKATNDHILTV